MAGLATRKAPMIAILTVTGLDHTGIVAAVSGRLATLDVNILNITQTILGEYFTMICQCEFDETVRPIQAIQDELRDVATEQGVEIRLQSEAIFRAMREV